MSKKPHGHYCRICGQYKANEKFSGRGHAAHICKACAKRGNKPPEIDIEPLVFVDIDDEVFDVFGADIDSFLFDVGADTEPPKQKKKRKPSKEKLLRAEQKKNAKAFLSKMLNKGDVAAKDIMEAASKAGIPNDALRRAKGSLGIRAVVTENGSIWRLSRQNKQAEVDVAQVQVKANKVSNSQGDTSNQN